MVTRRRGKSSPVGADADFLQGHVTVRMYRDILGDCFLLRFGTGPGTVSMLIDCGILQGSPNATARARRIMADIRATAPRLDVLVATHEHADHLSGFAQAQDIFEQVEVGELWLAWTENPRDSQAERLRAGRQRAMSLVQRSEAALTRRVDGPSPSPDRGGDGDDDDENEPPRHKVADRLRGLMSFSRFDTGEPGLAAGAPKTAGTVFDILRRQAGRVRYFTPGGATEPLPGVAEARVYILGPPRQDAMLKRSNPRKRNSEVYELDANTIEDEAFFLTALDADDNPELLKLNLPFAARLLQRTDGDATAAADGEQTLAGLAKVRQAYLRSNDAWRRIDADWLGAAENLALKLDSDTNNTSLALAIEVGHGPGARILLFPADAQVGNWLSWSDHVWPPGTDATDPAAITVTDLLARTVLYKVGHHGSHNATLREQGLELMTHPDLVAMLPVDQAFANDKKKWNMPFPPLLARLIERTGGRIIRADRNKASLGTTAPAHGSGQLTHAEWDRFLADLREIDDAEGPLALEYRIPLSG